MEIRTQTITKTSAYIAWVMPLMGCLLASGAWANGPEAEIASKVAQESLRASRAGMEAYLGELSQKLSRSDQDELVQKIDGPLQDFYAQEEKRLAARAPVVFRGKDEALAHFKAREEALLAAARDLQAEARALEASGLDRTRRGPYREAPANKEALERLMDKSKALLQSIHDLSYERALAQRSLTVRKLGRDIKTIIGVGGMYSAVGLATGIFFGLREAAGVLQSVGTYGGGALLMSTVGAALVASRVQGIFETSEKVAELDHKWRDRHWESTLRALDGIDPTFTQMIRGMSARAEGCTAATGGSGAKLRVQSSRPHARQRVANPDPDLDTLHEAQEALHESGGQAKKMRSP